MSSRMIVDLDRDVPGVNVLPSLPNLLLEAGFRPVLQLGSRYPWADEGRLRAGWVYPEHSLSGYASALAAGGAPLEVSLSRYGMIPGTEKLATFYSRFLSILADHRISESEAASYALFVAGLLEDIRELLGPVSRLFLHYPGSVPREAEVMLLDALRLRLASEGIEVVAMGLEERDLPGKNLVLDHSRSQFPEQALYVGEFNGEEVRVATGERPLWCRRELSRSFEGGEALLHSWSLLEKRVEESWKLVRRAEELETRVLHASALGDPAPLFDGILLRRRLIEALDRLRDALGALSRPLGRQTDHVELLLLQGRAAERAASRTISSLLPLSPPEGFLGYSASEDEARLDR